MTDRILDLDSLSLWLDRVKDELHPDLPAVEEELQRRRAWKRTVGRPGPAAAPPSLAQTRGFILGAQDLLAGSLIRAFHATRLLDPQVVLTEGLHPLDRRRQIADVLLALRRHGPFRLREAASQLRRQGVDPGDWSCEAEGRIWLVPRRASLHDGSVDEMFASLGGDFAQGLLAARAPHLAEALTRMGTPTVVACTLPLTWCRTASQYAPWVILRATLEARGLRFAWDADLDSWEVCVRQPVPAFLIQGVHPRHHARVAAPVHVRRSGRAA